MAQPTSASSRVYAFDLLRVFAIFSVLYGHSTLSFTLPIWVGVRDVSASGPVCLGMRESYELLHAFVLPVFFLVSGFLARRSSARGGAWAMLRNRCQQLLLPLVVGVLALLPLLHMLRQIGRIRAERTGFVPWSRIAHGLAESDFWRQPGPHYLWFLMYLLLFCVLTVLLRRVVRALASERFLATKVDAAVAFCCRSRWSPSLLCIPTLAVVSFVRGPIIAEVGQSFIPQPALVAMYWLYFLFGWLLHRAEGRLADLARRWKFHVASGLVVWLIGTGILLAVHTEGTDFRIPRAEQGCTARQSPTAPAQPSSMTPDQDMERLPDAPPPPGFFVYRTMKVYLSWALTFGVIGLAVKVCTRPNPWVRYLADASYWIYLAHVPLLMVVQILIADWHLPWWLKLGSMDLAVLAALLAVYHYVPRLHLPSRSPAPVGYASA